MRHSNKMFTLASLSSLSGIFCCCCCCSCSFSFDSILYIIQFVSRPSSPPIKCKYFSFHFFVVVVACRRFARILFLLAMFGPLIEICVCVSVAAARFVTERQRRVSVAMRLKIAYHSTRTRITILWQCQYVYFCFGRRRPKLYSTSTYYIL